ncbi:lactoylglutathione lyase [Marinobacterium zhoushanense]|uniref:Lactoylglutathione lyase n=1 Tax=Marinobacterium zhoushanense TaxID=1679163 RepID=A0ABQ1KLW6_9GAMM|nr:VOC family protein [Marinobacterium zhoushanense]GGC01825.1 lactoylglutathione lyase [Marinobacterium zhoushanense]
MLKIEGIDHIVLRTAQLEAMLAFYIDVLGCTLERDTGPDTGLVQLRAGDALIDIVRVDSELGRMGGGPPSRTENNLDHLCLRLAPISEQQLHDALAQAGVEMSAFEVRYGAEGFGPSVYIQDPDGNTVELRSALAKN